jgi:hypothetical protein
MAGPKYATAFPYAVALTSQANTKIFKTTPTLAAGDVLVSKDLANFANIGTLPVQIQTSGALGFTLTIAEMTASLVLVLFHDVAGAEWCDLLLIVNTETGSLSEINTDVESIVSTLGVAGAGLTVLATATNLALVKTDTAAILLDTGTDGVKLAPDAITAATFDESTAFPKTEADAAGMVLP